MADLSNGQRAYLDSLKADAGSKEMAEVLEALAQSQMGGRAPLDQSVANPAGEDTKPSGWLWRLLRR